VSSSPIVNRVRELRQARADMTQDALARQCSVTRQTIIALESGRYSPSLELAFRLAQAFGVGIDDIFQWQPPKKRE
jgi:putative transcriptional regulator